MSLPIPHPRETYDWIGEFGPEAAFVSALEQGRLHHAWLLVGPPGVGKATFAWRAARRLMGARAAPGAPLAADPDDPACRRIVARASADLLALETESAEGKARRFIPVDEVRALGEFFSKSPAAAPYRVAIVDAADDLNVNAANALLKALEEPPAKGVIFLVSHAPGRLLPTIRSRCRRLVFRPPPQAAALGWLEAHAALDATSAERLLDMAGGAPGAAWRLAGAEALEIDRLAETLLRALPRPEPKAMQDVADSLRGAAGAARFALLMERLADRVGGAARAASGEPEGLAQAARLAEASREFADAPRRVEGINLDRGEVFLDLLSRLAAMA